MFAAGIAAICVLIALWVVCDECRRAIDKAQAGRRLRRKWRDAP